MKEKTKNALILVLTGLTTLVASAQANCLNEYGYQSYMKRQIRFTSESGFAGIVLFSSPSSHSLGKVYRLIEDTGYFAHNTDFSDEMMTPAVLKAVKKVSKRSAQKRSNEEVVKAILSLNQSGALCPKGEVFSYRQVIKMIASTLPQADPSYPLPPLDRVEAEDLEE